MSRSARLPLALLTCVALAGCGGRGAATTPTRAATTPAAAADAPPAPEPTVQIDRLTGSSTRVTLDPGFLAALRSAGLRLTATGRARLDGDVLALPITGGNVTYYRPGTASPSFVGRVEHMGAGVALAGGGRRVDLDDPVLDPARAVITGTVSVSGQTALDGAPLLDVDGSRLSAPRRSADGRRIAFDGARLRLGPRAAAVLGETFVAGALRRGLAVGTAKLTLDRR